MATAATDPEAEQTHTHYRESGYGWLKAHLGSLALALAIVFAAIVWGLATSPAFVTLLTGFAMFILILGASAAMAKYWGWFGMVAGFVVSLMAYAVLFGAIDQAMQQGMSSRAKITASSAS